MTTLSKEDVVRIDNELLAMIQKHFPSLPLDDRYTDWKKWLCFARAVYSHGEQAARADLVAENERLKRSNSSYANLTKAQEGQLTALRLRLYELKGADKSIDSERVANATLTEELSTTRTALAAAEADNERLRDAIRKHKSPDWECNSDHPALNAALAQPRDDSALREMIAGVYEECVAKLKSKHDYECSAAAHHAKSFHAAYEYHMTRQAVVSECLDIIRALAEKANGE